ncbi:MAG TPA: hypothetical protein VK891_14825 [Euzebyales bacterium]|nr:hypothetical protein [Euzebyales bacterium]
MSRIEDLASHEAHAEAFGSTTTDAAIRQWDHDDMASATADVDDAGQPPQPMPFEPPVRPFPSPFVLQASGLYQYRQPSVSPIPPPTPIADVDPAGPRPGAADGLAEAATPAFTPLWFRREELRLDVDGRYPQMVASGALYNLFTVQIHWIANLTKTAPDTYTGTVFYTNGNAAALPYTNVTITVTTSLFASQRSATVTFTAAGHPDRLRTYRWKQSAFHNVELEYDTVSGTTAVTAFDMGSHPNRPAGLPSEHLSIETVYRRAGFGVTMSGGDGAVPLADAGADALWTDAEMHDAMQVYWSRFADKPQWSVWTLFASQHAPVPSQGITPTNLGGIMFDDIGPNHRQGTAVFNDSFIGTAPPSDPAPGAAVNRIKFWTAVHELGHTFNLAHSWQKSLGAGWVPLPDEPEARSFMNYPYRVAGGASAFFADFEYRFSDAELLFLRHAPERFVQHGNADWFDDHGFRGANVAPQPDLQLEVRVHRTVDHHEFLEPVVVELKLTNVSGQSAIVDEALLTRTDDMTVVVKQRGGRAVQWTPYARHCISASPKVLGAGESLYGSLFIAAGLNGWALAEPGVYQVQVALRHDDYDIVSNPLRVRVAPPRDYTEELLAQEVFTEDVGRTLTFNGSRALSGANDTLLEVAERLGDRRIATHAQLALGSPLAGSYKMLVVDGADETAGKRIATMAAEPIAARQHLSEALLDAPEKAADTLGHIAYTEQVAQYGAFLTVQGRPDEAAETLKTAEDVLASRGVLASVVDDLASTRRAYADEA